MFDSKQPTGADVTTPTFAEAVDGFMAALRVERDRLLGPLVAWLTRRLP